MPLTEQEQERIEKLKALLSASGVRAAEALRFPYTYHHDWYRARYYPLELSRAAVAERMDEYRAAHGEHAFLSRVLGGALLYLFSNHSEHMVQALLNPQAREAIVETLNEFGSAPAMGGH